jgi:Domain of unknown function (DUF4129)
VRSNAWPETTVAVLAACSLEAAWITLLYITVTALATHAAGPLSLLTFALAALAGLLMSRRIGADPRDRDRTLVAAVAVGVGLGGWLIPLGLDATRVIDQPYALLEMNPAGILLGLAVVRGSAHLSELDDERIAGIAIGPGLAFVAAIWFVLTLAGATDDPAILGDAFAATITFVTAGLLSMGMARLAGLREAGTGPAGRHTWIGMLVAVIAGLLVVALPLALVIGAPVDTAVRGVLGPLTAVLVPIVMILALPAALILSALVALFAGLQGGSGGSNTGFDVSLLLRTDFGSAVNPSGAQVVAIGLVPIVVAIVVAFLVVRTLLHRTGRFAMDDEVVEIRETERPSIPIRLRVPKRPAQRRPRVPETASEAYLATLELIARTPGSARLASETPREHARRMGSDPAWLPLHRLAADYTLAEFGRRVLTAAEHRRAIDSWRRLSATIRDGRNTTR